MKKLFLLLFTIATFAIGADVKPFVFENIEKNDTIQQMEWDILMKYKVFGAYTFNIINNSVRLTDKSGWIGTSKGDLILAQNGGDTLGGPIVIGGDLTFKNGPDVFTTGPLNVYGNVNATEDGFKGRANIFNGFQCVKGTVDTKYEKFVPDEYKYFGDNYDSCPIKDTHPNDTNLVVPYITTADTTYQPAISIDNKTEIITVPDGSYKEPYDLYIDKISFANAGKLVISQQSGGRLTRIFLKNGISYSNNCSIVVAYRDSITGENVELENSDYSGTLLFYSLADITTASFNKDVARFQGSIISYGKIEVAHHMVLAGQLLANNMQFDTDFDGSGFLYVPFDPPVLNIDPTALASGKFVENNLDVKIPITLDTIAKTAVYFNYCFDLDNSTSDTADFNGTIPICGQDSGSVTILDSTKTPVNDVFLNVKVDNITELDETLKFKIFNLTGAVLPGNVHTGYFTLYLTDGVHINEPPVIDKTDTIKKYDEELAITPDSSNEVGKVIVKDEQPDSLKFTLVGPDTLFFIDEKGVIKTKHIFDYETEDTVYIVKVIVSDGELTDSANYVIKINNIPEPVHAYDDTFTIDENVKDTIIGTIRAEDEDGKPVEFSCDDTVHYSINPNTGDIRLVVPFDYETQQSDTLTVIVKDKDGFTDTAKIIINVTPVNEPVHTKDTTCSVKENYTGKVCKITGTDEDKTPVKYIVTDTTNYSIDSTGTLTIKNPIDYEKKTKDTVKVIVTDGEFSDTATVIIRILDEEEIPEIKTWDDEKPKDTVKTNDPDHKFEWTLCEGDSCETNKEFPHIKKDTVIKVCNAKKTKCDSIVVLFNDAPPVVTLTNAKSTNATIDYITIEEQKDDKIYVNKKDNEITVTVRDTVHKTEKRFNIDVTLDTIKTKDIKLKEYNYLIDESLAQYTPIGGGLVEVKEVIKDNGTEITLTKIVDKKGNPIDTIQTVTYTKKVNGKDVVISYKTDNLTGQKIGDYEVSYMIDSCTKITYFVNDEKKIVTNKEGNIGYTISYEYTDDFGNKAVASVEIIYDDIPPKVEILEPYEMQKFNTNAIPVKWTVNGITQDTLTLQRLEKGVNYVIRRYVDKAGNESADTIVVIMAEAKDIEVSIVYPVTEINQDKVDSFYSEGNKYNPKQPYTITTLKGDEKPDPVGIGFKVDIALPSVNPTGNVSTLSDIIKNDKIPVDDKGNVVGASNLSIPVEKYINENCTDDFRQDYHKNGTNIPLYNVKYNLHLWIYTSNANYVNDFEINYDIDYKTEANAASIANFVIDWIPEKDGNVKAKNHHSLGTGAYLVKLYSKSTAIYRCGFKNQKAGDKITKKEYNLKSFGYKRPSK